MYPQSGKLGLVDFLLVWLYPTAKKHLCCILANVSNQHLFRIKFYIYLALLAGRLQKVKLGCNLISNPSKNSIAVLVAEIPAVYNRFLVLLKNLNTIAASLRGGEGRGERGSRTLDKVRSLSVFSSSKVSSLSYIEVLVKGSQV